MKIRLIQKNIRAGDLKRDLKKAAMFIAAV
jgi:hypothetical protein